MNADSSRSHMVFTVRLTVEGGAARKLTFCDLGGCERRHGRGPVDCEDWRIRICH